MPSVWPAVVGLGRVPTAVPSTCSLVTTQDCDRTANIGCVLKSARWDIVLRVSLRLLCGATLNYKIGRNQCRVACFARRISAACRPCGLLWLDWGACPLLCQALVLW